jgi:hypothetical protein
LDWAEARPAAARATMATFIMTILFDGRGDLVVVVVVKEEGENPEAIINY